VLGDTLGVYVGWSVVGCCDGYRVGSSGVGEVEGGFVGPVLGDKLGAYVGWSVVGFCDG
jgi:hypothetical protein